MSEHCVCEQNKPLKIFSGFECLRKRPWHLVGIAKLRDYAADALWGPVVIGELQPSLPRPFCVPRRRFGPTLLFAHLLTRIYTKKWKGATEILFSSPTDYLVPQALGIFGIPCEATDYTDFYGKLSAPNVLVHTSLEIERIKRADLPLERMEPDHDLWLCLYPYHSTDEGAYEGYMRDHLKYRLRVFRDSLRLLGYEEVCVFYGEPIWKRKKEKFAVFPRQVFYLLRHGDGVFSSLSNVEYRFPRAKRVDTKRIWELIWEAVRPQYEWKEKAWVHSLEVLGLDYWVW